MPSTQSACTLQAYHSTDLDILADGMTSIPARFHVAGQTITLDTWGMDGEAMAVAALAEAGELRWHLGSGPEAYDVVLLGDAGIGIRPIRTGTLWAVRSNPSHDAWLQAMDTMADGLTQDTPNGRMTG